MAGLFSIPLGFASNNLSDDKHLPPSIEGTRSLPIYHTLYNIIPEENFYQRLVSTWLWNFSQNIFRLIRKVLATLALSMGTLSSGLAKGYTSPALDSILDNQPPHLYQSSNNDTW